MFLCLEKIYGCHFYAYTVQLRRLMKLSWIHSKEARIKASRFNIPCKNDSDRSDNSVPKKGSRWKLIFLNCGAVSKGYDYLKKKKRKKKMFEKYPNSTCGRNGWQITDLTQGIISKRHTVTSPILSIWRHLFSWIAEIFSWGCAWQKLKMAQP